MKLAAVTLPFAPCGVYGYFRAAMRSFSVELLPLLAAVFWLYGCAPFMNSLKMITLIPNISWSVSLFRHEYSGLCFPSSLSFPQVLEPHSLLPKLIQAVLAL